MKIQDLFSNSRVSVFAIPVCKGYALKLHMD